MLFRMNSWSTVGDSPWSRLIPWESVYDYKNELQKSSIFSMTFTVSREYPASLCSPMENGLEARCCKYSSKSLQVSPPCYCPNSFNSRLSGITLPVGELVKRTIPLLQPFQFKVRCSNSNPFLLSLKAKRLVFSTRAAETCPVPGKDQENSWEQ